MLRIAANVANEFPDAMCDRDRMFALITMAIGLVGHAGAAAVNLITDEDYPLITNASANLHWF